MTVKKTAEKPVSGAAAIGAGPGRPKGSKNKATKLREAIAADLPQIIAGLTAQAKAGDAQAARLLLERVLPAVRPIEMPAPVALPAGGSLADQGRALLAAAGAGLLAPGQAAQLLAALGALAKIVETDELAARIAALEERNAQSAPTRSRA